MELLLLFVLLFVLIFLGMEIAFVLMVSPIIIIALTNITSNVPIPFEVIPQHLYGGADSFSFTAIPLFILAGEIMNRGGLTLRLVEFAKKIVGFIKGGIGQVAVVINILMAGLSGSSVADCTATGSILIPAMKKEGYTSQKSAAIISAASTIGPVIPPSIPLIIIGANAGISVATLFIAGIIPGLIMGLALMIFIFLTANKDNIERIDRPPLKEQVKAVKPALLPLGMPVMIIGSIGLGIASPTEAAVLGVVYALIVTGLIYKDLSLSGLFVAMKEVATSTGTLMFTIAAGILFGWLATYLNIGGILNDFLLSISTNPVVILLLINIILLLLGMVLETIPIILLMVPVLFPIAANIGVDPTHLSIILLVNLMIGLITPPIGLHLFITASIARTSIVNVIKSAAPLIVILLIVLGLITYVPQISLFLPTLLQ